MSSQKDTSVQKVFGEKQLRDKILGFVIFDGRKASPPDIRNCRLVQKVWLTSVSDCLLNLREPLFRFYAPTSQLMKIADTVINAYQHETYQPPIQLNLLYGFFKLQGATASMSIRFPCISDGLVILRVQIPLKGCPVPPVATIPDLKFPHLKDFYVKLESVEVGADSTGVKSIPPDNIGNSSNLTKFIKYIFNGCVTLQTFSFDGYPLHNHRMPLDFESLQLPDTLVTLELRQALNDDQLTELLSRTLPKLATLALTLPNLPLSDNRITWSLYQFIETLENFTLFGPRRDRYRIDHPDIPPTTIGYLPEMERLERLTITTWNYRWSDSVSSHGLDRQLPKLKSLALLAVPCNLLLFRQWAKKSRFLQVQDLTIAFTETNSKTFGMAASQLICQTFPNISKLDITTHCTEIKGLQYIFKQMGQLTELRITVDNSDNIYCDCCGTCGVWDSLLLGIPVQLVQVINKTQFWEKVRFLYQNFTSIRSLTNLRKLCLQAHHEKQMCSQVPLTGEAVFSYGFLQMPTLRELEFAGRFKVSNFMIKKWEADGRQWRYSERVSYHDD